MQDMRIVCTSPNARSSLLSSLCTLVDGVDGTNGTSTYMAFESLDDDVGARIYGRWESRTEMEIFIRRADVNAFWMANKEYVRGMEQRLYVPNG